MSDVLQFLIVTAAACVAIGAIARPYFRRTPTGASACGSCPTSRTRRKTPVSDVQPLRLIRR